MASKKLFKLGVVFPVWGRATVWNLISDQFESVRKSLENEIEIYPVVIVSPTDPDGLYPDPIPASFKNWIVKVFPNGQMGRKWNAGFQLCGDVKMDAVMQMGSDNMITPVYIQEAVKQIQDGADIVGLRQCIFLSWKTGQAGVAVDDILKNPYGFGPGRVYSSAVLDRVNWIPYPPAANGRMELRLRNRFIKCGVTEHTANVSMVPYDPSDGVAMIDIKTDGNINEFDAARYARIRKRAWIDIHIWNAIDPFPNADWPFRFKNLSN